VKKNGDRASQPSSFNLKTELQTVVLGLIPCSFIRHDYSVDQHYDTIPTTGTQFGYTLEITGASRSWHETVDTFPEEVGADNTPPTGTSASTFDQVVRVLEDDDEEDEALFFFAAFSE
jgi:hypothetical protein